MKRAIVVGVVALAGVWTVAVAPAQAGAGAPDVREAVIVDIAHGADPAKVAARAGITPDLLFAEPAPGFSAVLSPDQTKAVAHDPAVVEVTPDLVVAHVPVGTQTAPDPQDSANAKSTQVIRAAQRRVGLLRSVTADVDGIDDSRIKVDVAVFDTGVDPRHPDLNVAGGVNCLSAEWGKGWGDGEGHGTMVAGLVGAIDNKIGIAGIAPGARIFSVRIADSNGDILDSSLRCGLLWLLQHKQIEVANWSFSGDEPLVGPCGTVGGVVVDELHALTCAIVESGVTIAAAAGNDSIDAGLRTPAAWPEVITVSAFAETDGLPGGLGPTPCLAGELDDGFATFSNFGSPVDISAPGVCTTSTWLGSQYAYSSGTSFATPFVAGAAALVLARNPLASPAEVRAILLANAEAGPVMGDPDAFPEGVLDVSGF